MRTKNVSALASLEGLFSAERHPRDNSKRVAHGSEIRHARRERDRFASYHDGRCSGPFDFVEGQLILGFTVLIITFLIAMAAEGLHWLTGGKVPRLIEWQTKKVTSSDQWMQNRESGIKVLHVQGNDE